MNEDIYYEEFDRRRPGFFSRLFGTYQREVISAKLMFDGEHYYINLNVKKYRIFTGVWYMANTSYKIKKYIMDGYFLEEWSTNSKDIALEKIQKVKEAVKFIRY